MPVPAMRPGKFTRALAWGRATQSIGATLLGIEADFQPPTPEPVPSARVQVDASPALAIPDNNINGISSRISVTQPGTIARLTVGVDIAHTYIGDLKVIVTAPSGASVVLHDRAGARTRDLVASYTDTALASLAALRGQPAQGDWVLQVVDLASVDEGCCAAGVLPSI